MDNDFAQMMVDAAEATDRKLTPGRIALLKKSYAFFREAGLSDEEIKETMALTGHEMRLILKP